MKNLSITYAMPWFGGDRFSEAQTVNRRFGERNSMKNVHLVTFDESRRAPDRTASRLHHQSIYYSMHLTHINPKP